MPQITTSTGTPLGYTVATMQTQVNNMLASMQAGNSIAVTDIRALIDIYNQLRTHYHNIHDLRGVDTFGNVGVYGPGTYVDHNTDPATAGPVAPGTAYPVGTTYPPNIVSGGQITAADINQIIGWINSLRVHVHTVVDITS